MNTAAPRNRIKLDSRDVVWIVQEGEASVIVEPAAGSDLPRATESLVRAPQGSAFFGVCSSEALPDIQVHLALSAGGWATSIPVDQFLRLGRKNPAKAVSDTLRIVRQLASFINPEIPPVKSVKMLKPGGNFRLPNNFYVTAQKPLWFTMQHGACRYGGAEALPDLAAETIYPMCGNLWLHALEKSKVTCFDTEALLNSKHFIQAMYDFGDLALRLALENFSDMAISQFAHILKGARHSGGEVMSALKHASEVIESDGAVEPEFGVGMVDAIAFVTQEMGMSIKAPPRLGDTPERQLSDTLSYNNLFSRRVTLTGKWHKDDSGPLLGYERDGAVRKPVALLPGRQGYEIARPGASRREPVRKSHLESIEDEAVQIYTPLPPGAPGPLKLVLDSLKGSKKDIWLVLVAGLVAGLCGFALPLAMSFTVDTIIVNGERDLVKEMAMGLLMVVFGSTAFEMTKSFALLRLETKTQISLQAAIIGRVLSLPPAFFDRFTAGDLSKRVTAVDGIRRMLTGAMLTTLLSSTFAMVNLALLFIYSWKLAAAVVGILAVTLVFIRIMMKRQMKIQTQIQDTIGKLAGLELQLITGVNKLRSAGAESSAYGKWLRLFTELRKITYAVGKGTNVVTVYSSGLSLFISLSVFALFLLSGLFTELSLGSFLCFTAAMGQLTGAVAALCNTMVGLVFLGPMYQRALPVLEAKPETHQSLEDPGELKGEIGVANLSFVYPGADTPTLKNVSMRVTPGQFVAIVGETGSGKSTLLKMLLGFRSPNAGAILYDGKELSRLDKRKVRRQIGAVIQNGELFQGNIFFNIMGAHSDDSEEEAWEAARLAAVDEDIRNMPMGMKTFVPHGGGSFSGGQKQRIMIARALAKQPKIFLLDEATSNLDNKTQAQVMENLNNLHATRIVVAHRLSTIQDADMIYVMRNGVIVEKGTFEELLKHDGLFTRLAHRQMTAPGKEAKA